MICEKKNLIFNEKFSIELHHNKVLLIHQSNKYELHES